MLAVIGRYNRIIGGLRFRQEAQGLSCPGFPCMRRLRQVSTDDKATCTHFGDEATFRLRTALVYLKS